MAFQSNALDFPNLTAKGTPVGADIVMIADSAASNAVKQATLTNILSLASAGALTKIATVTASASATVNFDNKLSSTYDNYVIIVELLQAANGLGVYMQCRFGYGGTPTYDTGSTYYSGSLATKTSSGAYTVFASGTGTSGVTAINITDSTSGSLLPGANYGTSAITITGVNSASGGIPTVGTAITSFMGKDTVSNNYPDVCLTMFGWNGNQALGLPTSVEFYMSTGNIASGIFKLYGYQN